MTIDDLAAKLAWTREGKAPILPALGQALLGRPFPASATRRVLLAYQPARIAQTQFYPFLHHAQRFAAHGIHFRAIPFSKLTAAILPKQLDALFLQSSYTPAPGELEGLLGGIRAARPDLKIAYFDWFAPTDIRFAERVDPWVDYYVKKALLRDRAQHIVPTVGHTILDDHYADRFGLPNPPIAWDLPPSILGKLVLGPSFSTGPSLIGLFEGRDAPPDGPRPIDLHARIAVRGSPWYSAMRRESRDAVTSLFPDLRVASEGLVPKAEFMREMEQSKLCFSPFGYGEICWRDFEAIATGAVVIKQDMSHLESDPDIYLPFETYIPVKWDLSDLDERVRAALADPAGTRRIAERAFTVVRDHLRGPALETFAQRLTAR